MKTFILAALAATCIATPALAGQCDYADLKRDVVVSDQPCTITFLDNGAQVIKMGKRTFTIREQRRQGQWSFQTFDGKPAVRYETNRYVFSYSTVDLNETLDVRMR